MTIWHRDFFEIDLDKVESPVVNSWGKATEQDMRDWIVCVKEIQSLCKERGFTSSDFQRLQNSLNPQEKLIYDTYCHLYEPAGSHIKVVWNGENYSIDNGHHRILIAKQLGIRHIPAQVQSTDENTLKILKADGEKIAKFEKPLNQAEKLDWFKQVRTPRLSQPSSSTNVKPILG